MVLPLYDNIRRRRIELNMSQQELAEKSGYTDRSSIAKIETGKVDLTQSKIIAIAKALKIEPGQLMGWTEAENRALWRYTTIEGDKIVRKFSGLNNPESSSEVAEREHNSPVPFDISPNIYNADTALTFALWEGDSEIVDDEMIEDIKDYAKLLAARKKRRLERKE